MNQSKLQSAISAFVKNKKANAAYYDDNWAERKERKAYYQSFTKDKLLSMAPYADRTLLLGWYFKIRQEIISLLRVGAAHLFKNRFHSKNLLCTFILQRRFRLV